jgi:hypothetical protein
MRGTTVLQPVEVTYLVKRLFDEPRTKKPIVWRKTVVLVLKTIARNDPEPAGKLCFAEHERENGNKEIDANYREEFV